MSPEHGSAGVEIAETPGPLAKPVPGRGEILIWSVDFPVRGDDSPEQPTPTLTASVRLAEPEGFVVLTKPAHPIDYQSGVIRRGSPVEVRYENPETADSEDDPAMLFELIDTTDSDTADGHSADSVLNSAA